VFNVLFVGYSLTKNNLNNTSIQHDIKNFFQDNEIHNYINKIQSESFFVPVSVVLI
jgi:disulfide oxidoreductase YuzD